MAGVVLETISWRKLIILGVCLLVVVLLFCVVGAVVAPDRDTSVISFATFCVDSKGSGTEKWFIPSGIGNCTRLDDLQSVEEFNGGLTDKQIVFAVWLPLRLDGRRLSFSRWQRSMVSWLELGILDSADVPLAQDAKVTLEARLGYRNKGDNFSDWKELASSQEERALHCKKLYELDDVESDTLYECDVFPFFELASLHHDYYLINFRLPVRPFEDVNMNIGKLRDVTLTAVFQNGGFTRPWLYLQTMLFSLTLMVLVWYWHRVRHLIRKSNLLERTVFALGITISFLNFPLEWLILVADIPAITLINNFRHILYFGCLMSFGVIFAEEHLCEWPEGNFLTDYWKRLFAIFTGCFCFGLFKVCERGVVLANPLGSIWASNAGLKVSLAVLITLGVAVIVYFIYLVYITFRLLRYISINEKNKNRATYRVGMRCVLASTILCVGATIAFFVLTELWEGQKRWTNQDLHLNQTAVFWFGVYSLWNMHAVAVLSLFAPSQKPQRQSEESAYGLVSEAEDGENQA